MGTLTVCAWCSAEMAAKPGPDVVTHGICPLCFAVHDPRGPVPKRIRDSLATQVHARRDLLAAIAAGDPERIHTTATHLVDLALRVSIWARENVTSARGVSCHPPRGSFSSVLVE